MVMQVFRGDDDGDNSTVNPSSPVIDGAKNRNSTGRRWFIDEGHSTESSSDHRESSSITGPQFLKFADRKPAFDFSEPKPA